jgi:hypothetical protein
MSADKGGPAFPSHGSMGEVAHEGMTLRDYFAAKAMQGLLASLPGDTTLYDSNVAKWSYEMADAMLKARGQ